MGGAVGKLACGWIGNWLGNCATAAVSPPVAGFLSDLIGIPRTIMVVSTLTLATIPFAFLLKDPRRTASV
jgi:hypothetical protein